jgi:RecA/RadA recombinase
MGRKPKDVAGSADEPENKKNSDSSKRKDLLNEFMKSMGKDNQFEIFSESKLTKIDSYVSSGSLSLNRVIAGSYSKGFPHGRITGLAGKKGVGKSFVCGNALREAQANGYLCFVFESESSLDRDFLVRLGVDIDELGFKSVTTVNEFKSLTLNMVESIHKMDPDQKIFIVMDSLGNLGTEKEMNDAREGHTAQDMGLRAKQLKSASRVLANAIAYNNACMVVTNHTYDQPGNNPSMPPTEVFSGGEGFNYICSTILNLKKYVKKEEVKQANGETEKVATHFVIKATTTKNRLVPEGSYAEILVSFKNGLHKWYGLLDDALTYGFFEKSGTRVIVKHLDGKSFFESQLYKLENSAIWEAIIKDLDIKVQEAVAFSSVLDADKVVDELETEQGEEDTK